MAGFLHVHKKQNPSETSASTLLSWAPVPNTQVEVTLQPCAPGKVLLGPLWAARPGFAWEICRNLTPLRWLPLCQAWPKVQFGRGQAHKHMDNVPLSTGGTGAGHGSALLARAGSHALTSSGRTWQTLVLRDSPNTVPGCSPESTSTLKGVSEMCNLICAWEGKHHQSYLTDERMTRGK